MTTKVISAVLCLLIAFPSWAFGQTTPAPASPGTASSTQTAKPAPVGFVLEDGTPVKLRLSRNLSSATDRKGDQVDFEVLEDVTVDNVVVVPRGALALATITEYTSIGQRLRRRSNDFVLSSKMWERELGSLDTSERWKNMPLFFGMVALAISYKHYSSGAGLPISTSKCFRTTEKVRLCTSYISFETRS